MLVRFLEEHTQVNVGCPVLITLLLLLQQLEQCNSSY